MSLGGVFNTVLLETRQRTREMAVLKAIGLTPAPGGGDGIATVIPVGLVAGIIGVPIGLARAARVLGYMGEVAAKTRIPTRCTTCSRSWCWSASGCSASAIGALGAYLPAQRAARASIAPVLQAE